MAIAHVKISQFHLCTSRKSDQHMFGYIHFTMVLFFASQNMCIVYNTHIKEAKGAHMLKLQKRNCPKHKITSNSTQLWNGKLMDIHRTVQAWSSGTKCVLCVCVKNDEEQTVTQSSDLCYVIGAGHPLRNRVLVCNKTTFLRKTKM